MKNVVFGAMPAFVQGKISKGVRIAINTGDGDAPGLNVVIEAVVMSPYLRSREVYGIKNSSAGLLGTDEIVRLAPEKVHRIPSLGGTIL